MTNAAPHPSSASAADRPAACPHCAGETDDERLAHYKRVLRRLTEIGMSAAEALERQIVAEADRAERITAKVASGEIAPGQLAATSSDPKPVAAYTGALMQAARSVRLTLMLEDKLIETFRAREKVQAAEHAEHAAQARKEKRRRNRTDVERVVREAIRAEAGEQNEYDHLIRLMNARFQDLDVQSDLSTHTAEDLIVRLCRDQGLNPDWSRWEGEAWLKGDPPEAPPKTARHCPACCPACPPAAPDPDPP
jgi:hypothetical protein